VKTPLMAPFEDVQLLFRSFVELDSIPEVITIFLEIGKISVH
jgi:hypothetical protein